MTNDTESNQAGSVVVIGAAGVDLLGRQSRPGRRADSIPGLVQRSPGGVGRNIAESIARLGQPVRLVSLVGSDADGDWLLDVSARAGVDVSMVGRSSDLPTPRYLAVHDYRGGMTAAVSDMRLSETIDAPALQTVADAINDAAAVVIDANLSAEAIDWLAWLPAGLPLFADAVSVTKAPRLQPLLSRLDTLKLNLAEARALSGRRDGEWQACGKALVERGTRRVVISLGQAGIGYCDARERIHRRAPDCRIDSDTGAGDALTAGLVAASLRGLPLTDQLDYALACAGVTLETAAAVQSELSEARVSAWIEENL